MPNLKKSSHHQEDASQECKQSCSWWTLDIVQSLSVCWTWSLCVAREANVVIMLARSDVQLTRGCAAGCLRPIPLLICGTEDMATSVQAGNYCSQQIIFAVVIADRHFLQSSLAWHRHHQWTLQHSTCALGSLYCINYVSWWIMYTFCLF